MKLVAIIESQNSFNVSSTQILALTLKLLNFLNILWIFLGSYTNDVLQKMLLPANLNHIKKIYSIHQWCATLRFKNHIFWQTSFTNSPQSRSKLISYNPFLNRLISCDYWWINFIFREEHAAVMCDGLVVICWNVIHNNSYQKL